MEVHESSKFKKNIEKLRDEILFIMEGQESGQSYRDGFDEADRASDMINLHIGSFTSNNLLKKLGAVSQMLKKIDDGTYGYCIECGTEIPLKRLKALPLTEYCISCQTEMENDY